MAAFWVVNNQFQKFIDSQFTLDYDSQITDKYFVEYTGIEVKHFKDTLLQHMGNVKKSVAERTHHQRQYDRSSGTESEVQDDTARSGNDTNDTTEYTELPEIFNEGKTFDSCTGKVDSELTHGSNVDIPNIHVCKQTLDLSAGTSLNGQKQQRIDLSADALYNPRTTMSTKVPTADMIELKSLFGPLFDEYFNGATQVVSKSSAITAADALDKHQQQPDSTSSTLTLATTVTVDGNFDL
ncbi:hypothetical protein Tco_0528469 [Tanacetum coccineum]